MVQQFLTTVTNDNSRTAYAGDLAVFTAWLGARSLESLTPAVLLDYVNYLRGRDEAASTINRRLSAVRAYLRWAALTGQVPAGVYSTAQVVPSVKTPKNLPSVLTPAEVERLLATPDVATLAGARDLAFLKLALATGCRLSELTGADVEDIDWERRRLVVDGKGDKQRVVLFTSDAASALVYYLGQRGNPESGPLFVNKHGERLSDRWVQKALAEYGEAAGIKNLHPHALRHAFATELLDRTGDLSLVQDLLGHERPDTTRIYTRLATSRHERAYREAMEGGDDLPQTVTVRERVAVPKEEYDGTRKSLPGRRAQVW